MKLRMWKRNIRTKMISEDHELKEDKYNEFYLPSVNADEELFISVYSSERLTETIIHLKR